MTENDTAKGLRMLSPSQLVAWVEDNTQIMRLRTHQDVLPGGYMAALAPVLVDWEVSDPYAQAPYAVLRNINYGGNPLERTTVLHSVRVPLDGVEYAEFTLVPSTRGGLRAPIHHAQLRFVFDPDKAPVLLTLAGAETGTDATLPDLVLSWESWRAPKERFSIIKGLAADFSLSLRVYAGPQRFLEDTLHGKDWYSYRLRMPGGREGVAELFKVGLALGDSVARRVISQLLERGQEDWLKHAPPAASEHDRSQGQWEVLQERAQRSGVRDPLLRLPQAQDSYQTLLRSCATLARYTILVSAQRLIARGHTEGVDLSRLPEPALKAPEPWMKDLADADVRGIFMWAPAALKYILSNPESIPAKIPEELTAAGLLERRGGRPWMIQYARDKTRPYGELGANRIE
jgi:hypothetical protein